jgi:hypothetical protein
MSDTQKSMNFNRFERKAQKISKFNIKYYFSTNVLFRLCISLALEKYRKAFVSIEKQLKPMGPFGRKCSAIII